MDAIDPLEFRRALGAFTTGVTIVTTRDGEGNDIGLTANSFNSVSLDPPLILWSLAKSALSLKAFIEAKYFAVHILAADQRPLSERFARRGVDKFAGLALARGHGGVPLLDGCAARFECETAFRYDGGDHEIFVGRVIRFEHFQRPSLAFAGGKYALAIAADKPPAEVPDYTLYDSLSYLVTNAHHLLREHYQAVARAHRLGLDQISALLLLGMSAAPRTREQMVEALAFVGADFSEESANELVDRGYMRAVGEGGFELTDQGRGLMIEASAVMKVGEEEALEGFDYAEVQTLRLLLKRLVRGLYRHRGKTSRAVPNG